LKTGFAIGKNDIYAGQKGPFFWFVFFGPAKKMNKIVNQQRNVRHKASGLLKNNKSRTKCCWQPQAKMTFMRAKKALSFGSFSMGQQRK